MPLILDVAFYDTPVAARTYSGGIIAIGPELPTPEIFTKLRQCLEEFTRRDTFELPYDLTDAVLRMEAHEQMDVVLVVTHLLNDEVIPKLNLSQGGSNTSRSRVIKQGFAILHRKDQVVVCVIHAVIRSCDSHLTVIISERNLRFPSDSLPPVSPRGKPRGKCWNIKSKNITLKISALAVTVLAVAATSASLC